MDFPCRIGGDEFALLIGETNEDIARRRADELVKAVAELGLQEAGEPLKVCVSIGGTMHLAGDDAATLMKPADEALYEAKDAGRSGFSWVGD